MMHTARLSRGVARLRLDQDRAAREQLDHQLHERRLAAPVELARLLPAVPALHAAERAAHHDGGHPAFRRRKEGAKEQQRRSAALFRQRSSDTSEPQPSKRDQMLARQKSEMLPLVNDLCAELGSSKLSTVIVMHRFPSWMPSLFRVSDLLGDSAEI